MYPDDYTAEDIAHLEKYEDEKHQKADKEHPDMEDRFCFRCSRRLIRNSMAYHEGFHFDSCF